MITYDKSYYWLIRLRYFAYTVSPSHWTYLNNGRYSLACCSPKYLQHAFFVLICKMLHAVCDWFASQHWAGDLPRFRVPLLSTGSFALIIKWSTRPMVYSPCQLHYLHGNRPAILNIVVMRYPPSNTDEIRGGSIVKTLQLYVIITSGEHFVTIL